MIHRVFIVVTELSLNFVKLSHSLISTLLKDVPFAVLN